MEPISARIESGPVFGTFVKLPRPEVIDILALAGFDCVICDYEHAQMDAAMALETVRAARAAGLPALVRIPELDRGLINRLLEAGADGIQLARASAPTATELARLMRYPPQGSRSISLSQPAARYATRPLTEYLEASNDEVLAVGQFETAGYAHRLDEAVAALDLAFIGPVDLSVDLGHPGDPQAAPVQRAIAEVEAAAARTGTPMGAFVANREEAERALAKDYRLLAVSADLSMLGAAASRILAEVRPG